MFSSTAVDHEQNEGHWQNADTDAVLEEGTVGTLKDPVPPQSKSLLLRSNF